MTTSDLLAGIEPAAWKEIIAKSRPRKVDAYWLVTFEDGRQIEAAFNPGTGPIGSGLVVKTEYVPGYIAPPELAAVLARLEKAEAELAIVKAENAEAVPGLAICDAVLSWMVENGYADIDTEYQPSDVLEMLNNFVANDDLAALKGSDHEA